MIGDITLVIACGAFICGFLLGIGATVLAFARDKRVVTLQPGQAVVDRDVLTKLQAAAAAGARNSLRSDPRATVPRAERDPEDDFGDGEEDE